MSTTIVLAGGTAQPVLPPGAARRLARFVKLGVEHIFTGYDHIVFLLGLLLAGTSAGEMVRIVTSFTVAHSLTLALAGLGLLRLPSGLVEAAIAMSIVYVAVENLVARDFRRRWRVTFALGLVHGLGFASVLHDVSAGGGELLALLASFNVGVELGQVAICAAVFPLFLALRRRSFYPAFLRTASLGILGLGLVWLAQRVALA